MPDMERLTDQLKVDMARIGHKANDKSADYWDGFRQGKSHARWEVAVIVCVVYFGIAAIGHYYG